ncbi:MAG: hypothetical protein RIR62_2838 [Pseudomonadota bacterium]
MARPIAAGEETRPHARAALARPSRAALLLPLLLATACTPVPQVAEFRPTGNETAQLSPIAGRAAFWTAFGDRQLDALMQAGLKNNLSLREAAERITEAQAATGVPRDVLLGVQASTTRGRDGALPVVTSERATLSGTWLLDFFGGPSVRAQALARRDAAYFEAEVARLGLAAEIATAYIDLRYAQAVIAFTRRSVDSRRQSRSSIGSQFEAGAATRLDVLRADQRLALAEAQLPQLEVQAEVALNRLARLTAQSPSALRSLYERGGSQPVARWRAAGIGADTVRLRPDVQAAEGVLAERAAAAGIARSALLPSLTLGGNVSVPGSGARSWSFGPVLNLPLFSAGANRANLNAAESRARQAYLAWQASVLGAVEEIGNALAAYRRDGRNVGAQQRLVAITQETLDLARSSYDLGETDFLSILDAEVELLDARQSLAVAERARAINFVRLNVATAGSVLPR